MDNQDIDALQRLVPKLVNDPTLLSDPLIDFFCDYIESLGGKIPESAWDTEAGTQHSWAVDTCDYRDETEDATGSCNVQEEEEEEPEIVESDIELDESYVVEPDNDPPQKMGDSSIEVTAENRNASQEAEIQAMKAIYDEEKLEEAVEHLTVAIRQFCLTLNQP
ncbi:unnamed protein product [Fraxinus pennsylvanica]|uniref:Hsp70-interacting protein N-terminal domain-containing protein n=1 Tax=Fraxinus pennsylvanica TaxID=56036 RepID=A0AAD2EF21_9LAMI|nr:unnamed protein product [Fraxinus pennsylvanica]